MAHGDDIFRPGDGAEAFAEEVLEEFDNTVSVVDEDGKEHIFEELGRAEVGGMTYVALAPLVGEEDEEADELILLRMEEEDGEVFLSLIEDDAEYDTAAKAFSEFIEFEE